MDIKLLAVAIISCVVAFGTIFAVIRTGGNGAFLPAMPFQSTGRTATTRKVKLELINGIIHEYVPKHGASDVSWFVGWSRRLKYTGEQLPRVLIYTWCNKEDCFRNYLNELYWKACYAHAHGFDIVFSSAKNFSSLSFARWNWPMFTKTKFPDYEMGEWAWIKGVIDYIASGRYDYIFMMTVDTLIQVSNFDFPVWAWDRGHDITIMDEYHFVDPDGWGLNMNCILFKTSSFTTEFLGQVFEHRKFFNLESDGGPFMETILQYLGLEAEAKGHMGYDGRCVENLRLRLPYSHLMVDQVMEYYHETEKFSRCFFEELDRLAGGYGYRVTPHFGFSPTYDLRAKNGRVLPQFYERPSVLGPWANCWRNIRKWWPEPEGACFAFRWNELAMEKLKDENASSEIIQGVCPDPFFDWHSSPYISAVRDIEKRLDGKSTRDHREGITSHQVTGAGLDGGPEELLVHNEAPFYNVRDSHFFQDWQEQFNIEGKILPRVLIYTRCTEDEYATFVNEVYWKSCYAHAHGFDIVFSSPRKINSGESVWTLWDDVRRFLIQDLYDYVFVMDADLLIQEMYLHFPVWSWDRGHQITIMDQHPEPQVFEVNAKSALFRTSNSSQEFIEDCLEYRKGLRSQGDIEIMEVVLAVLGREAEEDGFRGYKGNCSEYLDLQQSSRDSNRLEGSLPNEAYSRCFFEILNIFTEDSGNRTVGFSPSFDSRHGARLPPSGAKGVRGMLAPTASCGSSIRKQRQDLTRCFALRHANTNMPAKVRGTCPDPTFNWHESPFNPVNRGHDHFNPV